MAIAAVQWARGLRVGTVSRKAVLLVLADRAKDGTWAVWVGQEMLAAEAEVNERTVRRALADFERWGLIEREQRRRPDGYRTSDIIRLNVGAGVSPDTSSPDTESPDMVSGSSDQGSLPHRTQGPRTSRPTSPDIDDRSHRTPDPRDNGKYEAGSTRAHARARGEPFERPRSLTDIATADSDFERFWDVFPRQVGRTAALDAWRWALGHAPPDQLVDRAREYAHWVLRTGEREQFVDDPARWLRRRRWTDSYRPNLPEHGRHFTVTDFDWLADMPNGGAQTASSLEELGLVLEDGVLKAVGGTGTP